ncbi:Serine carboxypeptidase-like 45 [Linum perenne]
MRISTRSSLLQRVSMLQLECSNLGGFSGNGPFSPVSEDVLARNRYAFNKEVNILYLDSPAGTGFSYSANITSGRATLDDSIIASEGTDVCLREKMAKFLKREDVQEALHVRKTNWRICSRGRDFTYDKRNWENTTIELVGSLVMRGIRVLIYRYDYEVTFVPFLGTRVLVNDLANKIGLNTTGAYQGWLVDGQKLMGKR